MADPSDANADDQPQEVQPQEGRPSGGSGVRETAGNAVSDAYAVSSDSLNSDSLNSESSDLEDDGPGWMPAILAGLVLSGIIGFLFCGFSTWLLFQRRAELATRTIQDSYLPQLSDSRLDPETKKAVIDEVQQLGNDLAGGKYDNAEASAILQRLQLIPVLQWGELQAVEEFYVTQSDASEADLEVVRRNITRLHRGVELGKINSFDLHEILLPAVVEDSKVPTGFRLKEPMTVAAAEEVFQRVVLSVEQSGIPDASFEDVRLQAIVAEAIGLGATKGGF